MGQTHIPSAKQQSLYSLISCTSPQPVVLVQHVLRKVHNMMD